MLFADKPQHNINIPIKDKQGDPFTIGTLIHYLWANIMTDGRKELFIYEGHV